MFNNNLDLEKSINDALTNINKSKNSIIFMGQHSNNINKKVDSINEFEKSLKWCIKLLKIRKHTVEKLQDFSHIDLYSSKFEQNKYESFETTRLLYFIQYLNIFWSICDIITKNSGRLITSSIKQYQNNYRPKLVNFFSDGGKAKNLDHPQFLSNLILNYFGCPIIIISYSIRNLFIHNATMLPKGDFFKYNLQIQNIKNHIFDISEYAIEYLKEQCANNNVKYNKHIRNKSMFNNLFTINNTTQDVNLLNILLICQNEIDIALSLILMSITKYDEIQLNILAKSYISDS